MFGQFGAGGGEEDGLISGGGWNVDLIYYMAGINPFGLTKA